ncbi:hypothetical protein EXIGLDRAFT_633388 [Exidia glandulosa HHB12029]|uniref:Uncharacterized protein n=1 Tax=Exidia glandulosa HHB12029 TaxID=1314781 RepID=A0A166N3H5_EXIGL|nr:hypothetical protein EXIGLDRAFT_633388 [Exidia glandulosa HHB12029]
MDAARDAGQRVGGVTAMSPYLRERCPACFALASTGRSFDVGGDVHIAADGNFMHRRFTHAGECPPIAFETRAMVPKAFVDAVGQALEAAGKRPPRPYASRVPERVLKQCAKSHAPQACALGGV